MSLITHEVDPFADTIIILKNPCKNFAPWDETLVSSQIEFPESEEKHPIHTQTFEDDQTGKKLSKKEKKARMRGRASHNSTVSNVPEGSGEHAELSSEASSEEQGLVHDRELATRVVGGVDNPSVELAEPASGPTQSEDDEIHYLVSSRHLMLASPWFRRTLTREEFVESLKNPSDGRYHIQANDWDEEALLILLNIFHVRTRQVPATVSLEMLAKIAVLVDYYELENAEAIERDTQNWIASVRRNVAIPSSYCRNLMLWICISRVFCMSEEFEKATAVAIKESKGWIQALDLPIHQGITSSIDRSRCNALEHVISELHRLLGVYRDFNYSCPHNPSYSFQCGAFLFGALMKYMERWGCLSPRPENPFMGISLNEICNRSGMAKNTKWWVKSDCYDYYRRHEHDRAEVHLCSLNAKIDEVVQATMAKVRGLKLQDFRDNSEVSFQN
ncbi:hypothetical protein COCC4DRAFT_143682 [Bipolaris maydis ATCC 48331]|uniref:BTB domain-containing protein n=2 Tax=Cochliobolus heterostrophus TaxID=5016 RepID=M2TJK4_COCH5|nr:uncharacterized protein COCC4DRAFT_143682 [Bipolaris maydis ATCC 48331]EMD86664.1 hypothetical protein COCHEDRAFT_1228149 [Bipolaris maydis C5]ENI03061.1 hypothetical protein COCC4DRAFT_143682 [Bipolaris maydis ATCC 48331]KAJ6267419.1 hypothetical protein PSV08DRAFT_404467 [Bipolaris maydis]KAJ6267629.1 hypothetical protein PSV08DRAFT_365124 [Bipolaris maydis]